jgi:hypothetical protein
VTALAVARRADVAPASDDALVQEGVRWLVTHVNTDGGWGDTPDSVSNISTTALVWAALAFGPAEDVASAAAGAEAWIARAAGSSEPPRLAAALDGPKLSWRARDAGTPWLSLRVVLRRGGAVVEHRLRRTNLRGTRPVPLDLTKRWHVTVVAADSSGNRSRVVLGQLGGESRLSL